MIKDLKSVSLIDILPDNLLADTKVYAAAKAVDDELQRVTVAAWESLQLPRLDELPEAVLDLLAWQWHVDFYEPMGLDAETKRELIRQAIAWHRMKGTPAAVEKAVTAIYGNAKVVENWEYGGKPYYFKVETESVIDGGKKITEVIKTINQSKNIRSTLDGVVFVNQTTAEKYMTVAIGINRIVTINPEVKFSPPDQSHTVYIGGVVSIEEPIEACIVSAWKSTIRTAGMSVWRKVTMTV